MKLLPFLAILSLVFGVLCAGCQPGDAPSPTEQSVSTDAESPAKPQTATDPQVARSQFALFKSLPPHVTGVDIVQRIDTSHDRKYLYNSGFACGGLALGDVDGDGRLDIFAVVNHGPNRLYRQIGDWRFEDIADSSGVAGRQNAWGAGAVLVDIDSDGDLDIYVCNYDDPNELFINETAGGGIRFVERAAEFGLDIADACIMPYFCDYDRDGDLDVYIVCYNLYPPEGYPASPSDVYEMIDGRPVFKKDYGRYYGFVPTGDGGSQVSIRGRRDYLLRNEGPGATGALRYVDVTEQAGIYDPGYGLSAHWWDYDRDGDFDLYVANDVEDPDHLYRNNGDGTFMDVIGEVIPHTTYYSMGAAAGDLNNDQRDDFIVLDMAATTHFKSKVSMGEMRGLEKEVLANSHPRQVMRNALYINTGTSRMLEGAFLANLAQSDWSWAPVLADFDNDGLLDVFITNGMTRLFTDSDRKIPPDAWIGKSEFEVHLDAPENREQNLAFANLGLLAFTDVSQRWGLDHVGMSFAAATGDLDNDGDLDLVVSNLNEPLGLYLNRSPDTNRIIVRLRGPVGNRQGIGAVVTLMTDRKLRSRTILPQSGFASQHEAVAHFGWESDERVEEIRIAWPDGHRQVVREIPDGPNVTIARDDKSSAGGESKTVAGCAMVQPARGSPRRDSRRARVRRFRPPAAAAE